MGRLDVLQVNDSVVLGGGQRLGEQILVLVCCDKRVSSDVEINEPGNMWSRLRGPACEPETYSHLQTGQCLSGRTFDTWTPHCGRKQNDDHSI